MLVRVDLRSRVTEGDPPPRPELAYRCKHVGYKEDWAWDLVRPVCDYLSSKPAYHWARVELAGEEL